MKKKQKMCRCSRCGEIERDRLVPERCSICGAPTYPEDLGLDRWNLSAGVLFSVVIVLRATLG